jgi:hypothetical protein
LESFKFRGEWWLPENPDRREKGDIRFSQQAGIELNLNGSFRDSSFVVFDGSLEMLLGQDATRYSTILGISAQGDKEFTLVDSLESEFIGSRSGYPTQKCQPGMVLIGDHIEDFENEKYDKLFLQFSHLPEWAGLSSFSRGIPSSEEQTRNTWYLEYSAPEEVVCNTTSGKVVFFCTKPQPKMNSSSHEVVLYLSTYICVEPSSPTVYKDLHKQYIQPLQRFLTLATGTPNYVDSVVLKQVAAEAAGGDKHIQVFYKQPRRNPDASDSLEPEAMLFTLGGLSDVLENVVDSWLRLHTELGPVCDLFFSVQFASTMYLEGRFLNMVHATETYHRRRNQERGKGPALRTRMTDLLADIGKAVEPLIPNEKDFVDKVVDTRNYLTHYDPKKEEKAASGNELYRLTETLSYVVKVCLLRESGISTERCAELLFKNLDFWQLHLGNRNS